VVENRGGGKAPATRKQNRKQQKAKKGGEHGLPGGRLEQLTLEGNQRRNIQLEKRGKSLNFGLEGGA